MEEPLVETSPILNTNNLAVGYRPGDSENRVLSAINLSLDAGELICFMGRNGVGKSTLLRTLAGLQPALDGEVTISGSPLNSYSPGELAKMISLVLTDTISAGNLTSLDVIKLGRYPYVNWLTQFSAQDQTKVDEAINLTSVEGLLHKKVFELSDGQRQKVMIARALAQDGELMILDEPNSHLDLNNRVEIMSLLRDLSKNTNKAILIATHELDLALQTADRLWLAGESGEIVQGVAEDLVLNGEFDRVFSMKGFDLKTGKVQINTTYRLQVRLEGEGATYLWTKNALERNGISTSSNSEPSEIYVSENPLQWTIKSADGENVFYTIAELLTHLKG